MVNDKREQFKQELRLHLQREQLIKSYQQRAEVGSRFMGETEEMSLKVLELVRNFSLQLLPEINARNDLDFAKNLHNSWESIKNAYTMAHEANIKAKTFQNNLATSLAENKQRMVGLVERSGFNDKELEEIYQELLQDSEADQGDN